MGNEEEKVDAASDPSHDAKANPSIGLCGGCRWIRVQGTKRGARFYRCARADEDETFLRYPPVPVLRCAGFESAAD